jgi:NitT/TauT family transport system permease protein
MQESEIRGLDALNLGLPAEPRAHRLWRAAWPKLAAVAIALGSWQLVAISGWREPYVLPGPAPVFAELAHQLGTGDFWTAVAITMTRGIIGFTLAAVLGLTLGVLVDCRRCPPSPGSRWPSCSSSSPNKPFCSSS